MRRRNHIDSRLVTGAGRARDWQTAVAALVDTMYTKGSALLVSVIHITTYIPVTAALNAGLRVVLAGIVIKSVALRDAGGVRRCRTAWNGVAGSTITTSLINAIDASSSVRSILEVEIAAYIRVNATLQFPVEFLTLIVAVHVA